MSEKTEDVRGVRLLEPLHAYVSPPIGDNPVGEVVMVFRSEPPVDKIAVTFPVTLLNQMLERLKTLRRHALKQNLQPGDLPLYRPETVTVGSTDQIRGCTLILFNQDRDDSLTVLMPDAIALGVGEGLQNDVIGRMTDQQRRLHEVSKSKLLRPARKLILPGQI